ncbi:hypothetical protein CRYUN_Cryun04dG0025800 [Craigia yunnanensis]
MEINQFHGIPAPDMPISQLTTNILSHDFASHLTQQMWPGQPDCLWLCDYIFIQLSLPTTQHNNITVFSFLRSKSLSFVSRYLLTIFISNNKMISAKKLIKLAKKWQKLAASRRKRITSSETTSFGDVGTNSCSTSSTVDKGHFVVYSADQRRFVLPLEYLKNEIIRELFALAEEEFGLPSNGPLMLPCDAAFMEYVISLIKRHATKDMKKALLTSIASGRCSSSSYLHQHTTSQQLLISSF